MTQSARTPTDVSAPEGAAPDDADAGQAPRDPVTGTTANATGDQQAAENQETDPVA